MHVFFESVWKLHIGEIPEKPVDVQHIDFTHPTEGLRHLHVGGDPLAYENRLKKYNAKIAAIKQNALTVGNPEVLKQFGYLELPINGDFVKWPGGYEIQYEMYATNPPKPVPNGFKRAILTLPEEKHGFCENPDSKCTMNYCDENGCIERKRNLVDANLTLAPEEKKNTIENTAEKLTKLFEKHNREFRFDPQVSHRWIVNAFDEYTKTASGSVAAPKEEPFDKHKFFDQVSAINAKKDLAIESLQSENTALREALKELLPIAETELGRITNPFDYDQTKAIIEKARKLLSK